MKDLSHHWQFALLCAGIALVVIGLGKASRRIPKGAEARPQNPQTHTERPTLRSFAQGAASRVALRVSPVLSLEIVLLALITLLAFVLRAWALGDTIRQFVDELNFGTVVYYYWVDDSVALLQPLIRGFPAIYAFFQAETVELWGRNLAGLRGASVLIGTLTIPATWLLAKTLFETAADRLQGDGLRRLNAVALLAAFLLAVFPAHIHFSRLGMNNIADPLVGVAMLAFLARGLKHGRQLDFALGGVFLGLSQYFYEAGKLVFPPLVVLWIGWLLLANRGLWRARWRGLLVALIAALIVAAPIYYTTFGLGQSLTPRFDDVGRIPFLRQITSHPDQLRIFFEKIGWAFRVYVNAYEYGVIYYGGQTAILPLYLVPAFFLGLWAVIWHLRRPVVVLPLTLVITSLGNGLLTEPRLYTRFNITFPLLSLLAAAGLVFAVRLLIQPYLLTRGQTILMRRLVFAGLVLTALVAAVAQIAYYYGPHLAMLNQQIRAYRLYDGQDALLRAAQLPAGTQVHVIAERTIDQNYARGILGFLTDDLSVNVVDPAALPRETLVQQLATLPRGVDHAFFIAPTDNTTLLILNQFFVLSGPAFSPYDLPAEKQLVLYMAYARDNTRPDLRVAFLEGAQDGR